MGTPADFLPPELSVQSITELAGSLGLPAPTKVEPLKVTADYHSIYLLQYEGSITREIIPARADPDGSVTLVLRVSGRHLPRVKTLNEVGMMAWVQQNTAIPVPSVLRFSETVDNCIGHEFTLLEKAPGISLDLIYGSLGDASKRKIVEQLADFLTQLHSKPWTPGRVGGLVLQNGTISPGPALEETFWQVPDIENYTSYAAAALACYIHAIESHPSLDRFKAMLPKIRQFVSAIQSAQYKPKLDDVTYILAHKDLHFANIIGIVPATRWNPCRAFLWNGKRDTQAKKEQARMETLFETVCIEKGATRLLESVKPNALQKDMQTAINYIRAIVEVCPRSQAQDQVDAWKNAAEVAMGAFV